jgi:hypothetical protein
LIAHVTLRLLQPSPHLPCEHRDDEPGSRSENDGIDRRGLAAPPADPLSLCVPGHAFRSMSRLRGRSREKQETGRQRRSEAGRDEASDYGHRPAEHESDEILVPARLKKGGRLELNDHES